MRLVSGTKELELVGRSKKINKFNPSMNICNNNCPGIGHIQLFLTTPNNYNCPTAGTYKFQTLIFIAFSYKLTTPANCYLVLLNINYSKYELLCKAVIINLANIKDVIVNK